MLSYTELKKGLIVVLDGQPYEVTEADFLRMQQRKAVVQAKFKNIVNGKVISRNVHASENFEEAEVEKETVKYLYNHRDEYWFANPANPNQRFFINRETIGDNTNFLKPNSEITAIKFREKIVNIQLPIKMDLKVIEAPPSDKGDTATGGRKTVTLETGVKVNVPLFINEGDTIRVNTETGEYTERIEKN